MRYRSTGTKMRDTVEAVKKLELAIPLPDVQQLLERQLGSLFFLRETERDVLREAIAQSLVEIEFGFRICRNKYFRRNGRAFFDPFHTSQYCIFLFRVSRWLGLNKHSSLADRVYYLNKALNGLDLHHQVEMPSVFFVEHPVGSVIGRAKIGERFSFLQGCTVGHNLGAFPVIGADVTMFASSLVIGNCKIGHNVMIGAGAIILDQDIPPWTVVFGRSPELVLKPLTPEKFDQLALFDTDAAVGYA